MALLLGNRTSTITEFEESHLTRLLLQQLMGISYTNRRQLVQFTKFTIKGTIENEEVICDCNL